MSIFAPIDIYCERTDAHLWSEPANAITNLAFFIAAWLLYKRYRAQDLQDRECLVLIGLIAVVGTGSALFHTFANKLTHWGDIIPIGLFVIYYLWVSLRRLLGFNKPFTMLALAALIAVSVIISKIPDPYRFNDSIIYFPCLLAIFLMGWALSKRRQPVSRVFFKTCLWFSASLTFRSVDIALCNSFSLGTHFLWHTCNGVVVYLLVRAILDHAPKSAN
jgi:hypothetical protein